MSDIQKLKGRKFTVQIREDIKGEVKVLFFVGDKYKAYIFKKGFMLEWLNHVAKSILRLEE